MFQSRFFFVKIQLKYAQVFRIIFHRGKGAIIVFLQKKMLQFKPSRRIRQLGTFNWPIDDEDREHRSDAVPPAQSQP